MTLQAGRDGCSAGPGRASASLGTAAGARAGGWREETDLYSLTPQPGNHPPPLRAQITTWSNSGQNTTEQGLLSCSP